MMPKGFHLFPAVLLAFAPLAGAAEAQPAGPGPAPDFQEVYDLVRKHLAGMSEAELNRTAVQGLIRALAPKVSLVEKAEAEPAAGSPAVKQCHWFDGQVAYVRVGEVNQELPRALKEACERARGTNRLNGVVVDLRYADGKDYGAAAATADVFLSKERALLDWGKGLVRSSAKSDALSVPAAVLVNRQTAGAAEALAAALRETGAGLIVGSRTAGQAMVAQEYPLSNGDRLRIFTAAVQAGESTLLSAQGLKPDIAVEVSPEDERAYYADPFREPGRTNVIVGLNWSAAGQPATNRARRARLNEAELVRERREGVIFDGQTGAADAAPEKPVVQDPSLARALDVLKGLSVVRQSRF